MPFDKFSTLSKPCLNLLNVLENSDNLFELFLKTPNVFSIEYKHRADKHPGLNTIKGPCALTAMNVDYTSEGTYMTFEDGTMISYVMSLSFMELEPVYNSDYDEFGEDEIGF